MFRAAPKTFCACLTQGMTHVSLAFCNVSRTFRGLPECVLFMHVSPSTHNPAHTPAVTSHDDRFAALRMDSHKRQSVTTYVSYTFANESFRGRNAW